MRFIKNKLKYIIFKKKNIYMNKKNVSQVSRIAKLGKFVKIDGSVRIRNDVEIGDYSHINDGSQIMSGKIGRFCSIGYDCIIGPPEHPTNRVLTHSVGYDKKYNYIKHDKHFEFKDKDIPKIGDNVWIGARSIILKGVTIGEGSIIAANTVVTKDVAPYTIVGGIPNKLISNRKEKFNLKDIYLEDMSTDEIVEKIKLGYLL